MQDFILVFSGVFAPYFIIDNFIVPCNHNELGVFYDIFSACVGVTYVFSFSFRCESSMVFPGAFYEMVEFIVIDIHSVLLSPRSERGLDKSCGYVV